jgi:hypothetical protein
MAHGDINLNTKRAMNATLLDAESSTSDGAWVDAMDFFTGSVDVIISATGTVKLMGSDAPTKPADATDGRQIGSDITTSSQYTMDAPAHWIKAKVTANTGQIDAYFTGKRDV